MFSISLSTGPAQYTVTNLGPQGSQSSFEINGVGTVNINDLGSNTFGPPTHGNYACITFCDRVWAFSYDGMGQLNISYSQESKTLTLAVPSGNGVVTKLTS